MRLNLFKYHVQNRNYSKAEIVSLINGDSYDHLLLSDNNASYSLGTAWDTAKYTVTNIVLPVVSVAAAVYTLFKAYQNHKNTDYNSDDCSYHTSSHDIINIPIRINSNNINTNTNYKITDIDNYINSINDGNYYSGREVTKFLNEYYNWGIHPNKTLYYNQIIGDLLSHKYANAEIPTLNNSGLFDIAVLDTYESITDHSSIEVVTFGNVEHFFIV